MKMKYMVIIAALSFCYFASRAYTVANNIKEVNACDKLELRYGGMYEVIKEGFYLGTFFMATGKTEATVTGVATAGMPEVTFLCSEVRRIQ